MASLDPTTEHPTTKQHAKRRCVHHWMVEPAGGPTSGARCRRCGEERSFFNDPDAVTEVRAVDHHRPQAAAGKGPSR